MVSVKKKFFVVALSLALIAPAFALADQNTDALIAELKAKIAELTMQLEALQKAQREEQPWCHTFNVNLKIGDSGDEIFALIHVLQQEKLISYGIAGSPPTTPQDAVFTENVASAVTGFQEKYRDEILTPNGLSHGTGYVGKSTRAKLNQLYGCGGGVVQNGSLYIQPSNIPLRVGETVQLKAMYQPVMPKCPPGQGCTQVMPAPRPVIAKWTSSNSNVAVIDAEAVADCFSPGCHPYNVVSVKGISAGVAVIKAVYTTSSGTMLTATTNVSVTNGATTAPQINSISPQSGPVGTRVTLTGSRLFLGPPPCAVGYPCQSLDSLKFDSQVIQGVGWTSDGKTVTFIVPDGFSTCPNGGCEAVGFVPIQPGTYDVSVSNANGTSNSVSFTVTGATTGPSVKVLSPNGGETFYIGQTVTISWQGGPTATEAGPVPIPIKLVDINTGSVSPIGVGYQGGAFWTIPNTIHPGSYKIQVIDDESDAPFSIVLKP